MPDNESSGILPAVAAAVPLVGGVANAIIQGAQNKKSREWQEKMYGVQRQDALADWRMQNEYNSPMAQMARLRAAGLNPNLAYGHGVEAMSNSQPRASSTGNWSPHAPTIDLSGVGNGLMMGYDMKIKQAQYDNLAIQKELMQQEIKNKQATEAATYANIPKIQAGTDLATMMTQLRGQELSWSNTFNAARINQLNAATDKLKSATGLDIANTNFRVHEDARQAAKTKQSLAESASRILLNEANRLRAAAQTTTEYYKKQQLMNEAILIEKRIGTEDYNRQLKAEELRLKEAEPTYYEKQFTEAIQNLLKTATSKALPTITEKYSEGSNSYGRWWQHSQSKSNH